MILNIGLSGCAATLTMAEGGTIAHFAPLRAEVG